MKRILSVIMILALIISFAVTAMAKKDTSKCSSWSDTCGFSASGSTPPIITTVAENDGEIWFQSDDTHENCFITRSSDFGALYGSEFTLSFEFVIHDVKDTSENDIFQIQVKDADGTWDTNYTFFTISCDGKGGYYLHDKKSGEKGVTFNYDVWYQFNCYFDLEADKVTVGGGIVGEDEEKYYTTDLDCEGSIPLMFIGACDKQENFVYDFAIDTITLRTTFGVPTNDDGGEEGEGIASAFSFSNPTARIVYSAVIVVIIVGTVVVFTIKKEN